jgi:fibronectin type 3 domain-containing protein
LKWNASTSAVDGYNVYRSLSPGGPYVRINKDRVRELSFVDRNVEKGMKYYYVARAVDSGGNESRDSNEAFAAVP